MTSYVSLSTHFSFFLYILHSISLLQGNTCTSMDICMNCSPGKGCVAQDRYDTYRVDEYGLVNGTLSFFLFLSLTLIYIIYRYGEYDGRDF